MTKFNIFVIQDVAAIAKRLHYLDPELVLTSDTTLRSPAEFLNIIESAKITSCIVFAEFRNTLLVNSAGELSSSCFVNFLRHSPRGDFFRR